ncbi:helix-turn-helix domain-containing protein [Streptomyces iranensis]|uniref:DNA-binding CsgD family transcriptional regulator n=1 Tax=Streptomyces iranensis TaxID=576784 RepID=A0A061A2V5_9ACTN|nr:helix-turn-helix domain-containing protein [Streptomyces iranensis]MBP2060602.1 DNA-binding CsgD family transcriptional regulator [Streptomyces iranensis]CDR16855.1 DNA-binding protein [Streptomyces iranensis]
MEARAHTGRLDELLYEVRRQMSRGAGADPRPVLDWLGRQIDADVALVGGAGAVETSTARFPRQILPSLEPTLARLSGGQMAAAATETGDLQVRLEALGSHAPRPVLVVAGASAPTREAASLVSHAGSLIALLDRAQDADTTFRGYQYKARQLRFAVFSALLAGDLTLARRMTTGAVPALLDAARLRVYLLHCPPEDRDRLAQTYQDGSGYHGTGLMVHCPAFKEHLICLVADGAADGSDDESADETGGRFGDEPGTDPHDSADDPETAHGQGAVLRRLVRDNPLYALGISSPYPLGATAEAYGQALHALAAARHTPERMAAYLGRTPLVPLLPHTEAGTWARALLRPLGATPRATLDITRLAVTFPRSAVARLLDISRNTVSHHLSRVEVTLGLDLGEVRTRAALDLAFCLTGGQPDGGFGSEGGFGSAGGFGARGGRPVPTLEELFRTEPAHAWAREFLRPLQDTRGRDLRTTLRAWIDANTDAQRTARHLGLSRNTVRAHLRAAEHLLSRDLLTTGSGIHDLVHALHIAGLHPAD